MCYFVKNLCCLIIHAFKVDCTALGKKNREIAKL